MVDLRHFRSFDVVAQEGNIRRAAQRMHITQPALSRQMHQLEDEIGTPLLVRHARGVDLTDAGRDVLAKARTALAAAEEALTVGRRREPAGRLRVGLSLADHDERWDDVLQRFVEHYPQVEVEMHRAMSDTLQHDVATESLDVALTLAPRPIPGLSYLPVLDERLSLWVAADHPLARRDRVLLDELDGVRLTLAGRAAGREPGYNLAVRALFDESPAEPVFVETSELYPMRSWRTPGFAAISVHHDFPDEIVEVELVPERTMGFSVVARAGTSDAAAQAFPRFVARTLRER